MLSHIAIYNDRLIITDPSKEMRNFIQSELTYTDKSKQYQLRRMGKNIWQRNSPAYKQLQSEIKGALYEEIAPDKIAVSSCFVELLKDKFNTIVPLDLRGDTGKKIALPWVKKPYDLRDYQEEAVDLMLYHPRGLINLATGLGKTLLATHFIQRYKRRALIVCPSESVAKQFYEQFVECFGKNKVGFYGGGKKRISDITVGIAASITKNIAEFQAADLGVVIFDETHHTPATTFFDVSQGLSKTGKVFGLTATDYRSDGKDIMITAGCGPVLIRRDTKWGVENGWLAEPYFFVRQVYTTGKDYKDDKIKSYKEHVLNSELMKAQIRDDAMKMMSAGKSVLILVDEVAHGKELSEELQIPFATGIDSKSQEYVNQLNAGTVRGLVGTDGKIGEGSDTQNVDVLILANFVASKGPVTQAVGRGLRKQGAKTKCIILDYIPMGSTMLSRHGFNRVEFYKEITDKVKVI
jgi:superfamily II DNA or RNA helicase